MTPRVVVADGSPFIRLAIRNALRAAGIDVVAEVGAADPLVRAVAALAPDVVLLDGTLDEELGVVGEVLRVAPGTCVVVLSAEASAEAAMAAVRAGACGFVPQDGSPDALPAIVRGVIRGEAAVPRKIVRILLSDLAASAGATRTEEQALSAREREVLDLLSAGLRDDEIARRLQISGITVRRHAAAAMRKLGARDRRQALVTYARARMPDGRTQTRAAG